MWSAISPGGTQAPISASTAITNHHLSASATNAPVTVTVDDLWAATVGTTAQTMTAGMVAPLSALLGGPQGATTGTTLYLPGGQELTLDGSGQVTATRYYTFAGQTIAVRTGPAGTDVTSLVADPHATATIALTNDAADTMTVRRTDPYGGPRGTQPDWPGDHGFLNKPVDATGLIAIGARYYDPTLGRFITVDPVLNLADPQQWNAYAYAGNNPTTNSDPTGLLTGLRIGDDNNSSASLISFKRTRSGAGAASGGAAEGRGGAPRIEGCGIGPCDDGGVQDLVKMRMLQASLIYHLMYGRTPAMQFSTPQDLRDHSVRLPMPRMQYGTRAKGTSSIRHSRRPASCRSSCWMSPRRSGSRVARRTPLRSLRLSKHCTLLPFGPRHR